MKKQLIMLQINQCLYFYKGKTTACAHDMTICLILGSSAFVPFFSNCTHKLTSPNTHKRVTHTHTRTYIQGLHYFVLPFCCFIVFFPLGLLKQSDFGSELC